MLGIYNTLCSVHIQVQCVQFICIVVYKSIHSIIIYYTYIHTYIHTYIYIHTNTDRHIYLYSSIVHTFDHKCTSRSQLITFNRSSTLSIYACLVILIPLLAPSSVIHAYVSYGSSIVDEVVEYEYSTIYRIIQYYIAIINNAYIMYGIKCIQITIYTVRWKKNQTLTLTHQYQQ